MLKTKVAIVGMGTVGTGVAKLLLDHGDRTARHAGRTLWLEQVVVKDISKPRDVDLPKGILSTDLKKVTDDKEIALAAMLVGGLEPAKSITLKLLESGKDIVTANKALLAEHGPELFDRARELGRSIAFEASVAGGIPIVTALSQCLTANQIISLRGILNGTSNFIITRMEEQKMPYAAALVEAQRLGYAESDPSMDVDGSDAAQKLAILAHLAFGARVSWKEIPREGIESLDEADLRYALELGYRVKLLAVAQLWPEGLELHVSPTLIKVGSPLAEVRESYNAVSVIGDAVGNLFYHGRGAGQMPTASAVVADMIDTAVGRTRITFQSLKLWSQDSEGAPLRDHSRVRSRNYMRFTVADEPGVLAQLCGALGNNGISIASVIQHEPRDAANGVEVPVVIMTHQASEGDVLKAVAEIDRLISVRGRSVRYRVAD
jgi:homoserine dehydrogenase